MSDDNKYVEIEVKIDGKEYFGCYTFVPGSDYSDEKALTIAFEGLKNKLLEEAKS